ncbi:hypothetical protein [Mycolicibacterium wolinskyi]|uniref:hypothetical protein n=1 Tax=Mycolicibacterium wolinskyi TaxID=59750 RepID=UPI000AEC46A8|nr:hypothetical protein [Mycolicibacterium wolinskyi]
MSGSFEDAMARARGRLMALERAADGLAGLRDADDAATRRRQLLDGLVADLGHEREAT